MRLIVKQTDTVDNKFDTSATEHKVKVKSSTGYEISKRIFDIVCSALGMICLSWLFLIIVILIRCTSKGPAIYVSERIGKDGKAFKFYKFRSMYKDAESRLEELLKHNEVSGGITFKMKNDPRITPVGKIIRKASIDELPQLWNIFKGDMSIVGPRPCTVREYKLYSEYHKNRLLVPQGLTGEWQVNGRSTTSFDEMIELDLDYITNKRSFWYDIRIIFKTVAVVFSSDSGAE